jgi:ATP-dependent Clp protease ATP-binding subunit ClpA
MKFDTKCQAAVDFAKRALPDEGELDVGLLVEALYYSTGLKDRLPHLAPFLNAPRPLRALSPATVPVAGSLKPLLAELDGRGHPLTAEECFLALITSAPGREFLKGRGASEKEIKATLAILQPSRTPGQPPGGWRATGKREEVIKALNAFGRMLTDVDLPRGLLVGMERSMESLIRTLSRMRRRNAIIIGFPGTGKSALVYEFARGLREQDPGIPERLRDYDIFELSPALLRSGASMVGQYEERVKALIEILRQHPNVILFVDEIHSLLQSGVHAHTAFTEGNEAFKGVLGRGEITCIGCTTLAEYRHYIEPDEALVRRFSIIRLEPPSPETTRNILLARRPRMEEYYAPLRIPDAIVSRIVELTEDYLPGRYQPDKSIQLLDEASAYCATSTPPRPEVVEDSLMAALEDVVGHSVVRTERITEHDVRGTLRARIIGQDEVMGEIALAFVSGLGNWRRSSGPRGVFLFGGPTGVGKTATAVALARILGGGTRENLVRVDCNTLQGSGFDSGPILNRLLGVPPGYIGYARGQGGLLSRIRDYPESIVLFDEIEKADPSVGKLLLQILDQGQAKDVDENVLDFRRAFLIFTTNAGAVYDKPSLGLGFTTAEAREEGAPHTDWEGLKRSLRSAGLTEEFLGRIRSRFIFRGISGAALRQLISRHLEELRSIAKTKGFDFCWQPAVVEHVAARWEPQFGVRHLTGILRYPVTEQLSAAEAQGELQGVKRIELNCPEKREAGSGSARERQGDTLIIKLL